MELSALISRYAERFAELGDDGHQVGSPLGAWLVVALAGPVAVGDLRDEINDVLGVDVDSANALLTELLKDPHPAVASAMAAWTRAGLTGLDDWRSTLPPAVATGMIPTQAQADEWARTHSLGMIDTFPIAVDDAVLLVLASALATRVTWQRPFQSVAAEELRGPWGRQLTRVLLSPPSGGGHYCSIVSTQRAGTVAVHTALSNDLLEVTSVIADPEVGRTDVVAAAHEIATSGAADGELSRVSLFDLPLGESPLWTIAEHDVVQDGEHIRAILPAWRANSDHDLLAVPELGFGAAARALMVAAQIDGDAKARQAAAARYSREGFEAAAVTALAVRLSSPAVRPGPDRTAILRFGHPYAVIATTHARDASPWHDLPIFAAWVTEPDDAD